MFSPYLASIWRREIVITPMQAVRQSHKAQAFMLQDWPFHIFVPIEVFTSHGRIQASLTSVFGDRVYDSGCGLLLEHSVSELVVSLEENFAQFD